MDEGWIVAICLGALLIVAVILVLVWYFMTRKNKGVDLMEPGAEEPDDVPDMPDVNDVVAAQEARPDAKARKAAQRSERTAYANEKWEALMRRIDSEKSGR